MSLIIFLAGYVIVGCAVIWFLIDCTSELELIEDDSRRFNEQLKKRERGVGING